MSSQAMPFRAPSPNGRVIKRTVWFAIAAVCWPLLVGVVPYHIGKLGGARFCAKVQLGLTSREVVEAVGQPGTMLNLRRAEDQRRLYGYGCWDPAPPVPGACWAWTYTKVRFAWAYTVFFDADGRVMRVVESCQ